MGYLYYNLTNYSQTKGIAVNMLLIFCCMFTGENTIPLFGIIILMFLITAWIQGNKKIAKKYICHLFIAVMWGVLWILLWKFIITKVESGRFSKLDFSLSRLDMLKRDFVENFKYFLWIGEYKYKGQISNLNIGFAVAIFINIVILMLMYWKYMNHTNQINVLEKTKPVIWKFFIGVVLCFIGMTMIYVLLNVIMGYPMAGHYFYTIYTVLLCAVVIFLNYIPNRFLKNIINVSLILVIIILNIFWSGILMPESGIRNLEIENSLETMEKNGVAKIVVVTEGDNPLFGRVIDRGIWYRPRNAFSEAWACEAYLSDFFEEIILIPETVSVNIESDSVYLENAMIVYKGEQIERIEVRKDDTCFMYIDFNNDWKISKFSEFYSNWYDVRNNL